MIKLLSLIISIAISTYNANIVKYDNEIFINKFVINNFYIEQLAIKDNKFKEIIYYNKDDNNDTNYNSIKKVDINGDGIDETITYSKERIPEIQIMYNDGNVLNISLKEDLNIQFIGVGLHQAMYYIDIAVDTNRNYYLHSMCSNVITRGEPAHVWSREERYLKIENNKLVTVDKVNYNFFASTDNDDTWHDDLQINDNLEDNFQKLEDKYTIIEGDENKFIIPY